MEIVEGSSTTSHSMGSLTFSQREHNDRKQSNGTTAKAGLIANECTLVY